MKAIYRNTTGRGNVDAVEITVELTPHSPAGAAHARFAYIHRDGTGNTRMGKYFPTEADAMRQADEWIAKADASPDFVRES